MTRASKVEIIASFLMRPHDAHNCCVACLLSKQPPINEEAGLPKVRFSDVRTSSGKGEGGKNKKNYALSQLM